ncbi:MAG: hypothetical protein M3Z75_01420 [Actinomycetota bacterium]|nr:hypothetical protein [Actinomycetota bacterium]
MPSREPANPGHAGSSARGPVSGAGRHPGGPGYATPGRPRPEEPAEQFDGGYAYVISAAGHPVPAQNEARPGNPAPPAGSARPAGEAPADVPLYRDTSEPRDGTAAAASGQRPDDGDASYWYDLSDADSSPVPAQTRGPFEPLVSSRGSEDGQDSATHGQSASHRQTDPLEPVKDVYLTPEAAGEQNVDTHFDQMLAQQRELISGYFKGSGGTDPGAVGTPQAPGGPGDAGSQAEAPYGASVIAEP